MRLRIRKDSGEEAQVDEDEKIQPSVTRKNEPPPSATRKNNNDDAPEEDINNLLNDLELLKEREVKRGVKKEFEEGEGEEELSFEGPRAEKKAGIVEGARGQGEGWATSLLRSLDGAPDDVVAILPADVLQKMLEGIAKSQGDVGILARIMLKRLKSCLERK